MRCFCSGLAVIVILRNIFAQRAVRSDDVLGALCGYVIAAGAWSNLFILIEIFVPGSYSVGQGFGAQLDSWDGRIAVMNYVSLGSLTGVGSGAVGAACSATVLTTLEAVFGCRRGREWWERALTGTAAKQPALNLSARLRSIPFSARIPYPKPDTRNPNPPLGFSLLHRLNFLSRDPVPRFSLNRPRCARGVLRSGALEIWDSGRRNGER